MVDVLTSLLAESSVKQQVTSCFPSFWIHKRTLCFATKRLDTYRCSWVQGRDPSYFQPIPNRGPRSWSNFFFHGFVADVPVGIIWYPATSCRQRGRTNRLVTLWIYFCCQPWKTLESRRWVVCWMQSCARGAYDKLHTVTASVSDVLAVSQRHLWLWNLVSRTFAACAPSLSGLLTPGLDLWVHPGTDVE